MTRRFTPDPEAAQAKRDAAMERLSAGVEAIQTSEGFREYLKVAAKFHQYSFNNQILIWSQMPDASRVAGFNTWKDAGRIVRKGEKGIAIFAPMIFKAKDAEPDEIPRETRTGFRLVYVFDISQTDGDDLPSLGYKHTEGETAHELWARIEQVAADKAISMSSDADNGHGGAHGYYVPRERRIWHDPALTLDGRVSTVLHELAHSLDYDAHEAEARTFDYQTHRGERETVAEAVAYIAAEHYGLDTSEEAFTYVATWAREPKVLKARMSEIAKLADALIVALEAVAA